MRRYRAVLAWLLLAATPATAASPWSCDTGAFRIEWRSDDIVARARNGQRPLFSARANAAAEYARLRQATNSNHATPVVLRQQLSVVSLAGPLLGLRDEMETDVTPGAHPGGETRLRTIDLRSGHGMQLTALFRFGDIRSALLADPFLKPALQDDAPRTPQAFVADLAENVDRLRGACVSVPKDLLERFALAGVDSTGFLVRVGLPGAGPCRYNLTQVELHLPQRGPVTSIVPQNGQRVCVPPPDVPPLTLTLGE